MSLLEYYAIGGVAWALLTLKQSVKLMRDITGDHKVTADKHAEQYEALVLAARKQIRSTGLGSTFTNTVIALSFTAIVISRGAGWGYYMPRSLFRMYRGTRK